MAQQDPKDFIRGARQMLDNQADVSLALAKHLLLNYGKNSNLVFSPFSIQVLLSLLAAGSSGQSLEQLLSFLKAKTTDDLNHLYSYLVDLVFVDGSLSGGPCLSFANGVWIDKTSSLKPSFKEVVDTFYKAASHQVDFKNKAEEARTSVNSWVEKETNGLIKEILPSGSLSSLTRLVFANALYFKGEWTEVFKADMTKDYDFHFLNGDSIQVPFMTMWSEMQRIRVFDGFKVLKLPYSSVVWSKKSDEEQGWNYNSDEEQVLYNNSDDSDEEQFWDNNSDAERRHWNCNRDEKRDFSMYIFLPDAKDGLPALVEKAGTESGFLERHIPTIYCVDVGEFRIPKFKFEHQIKLSKALQTLGIVLPFDPKEGLSEKVDGPRPLFASKIFHKSCIEVNEGGTIAAAASAMDESEEADCCSDDEKIKIDFVADHPFLFFIREDKTGMVLFVGHVLDPSKS